MKVQSVPRFKETEEDAKVPVGNLYLAATIDHPSSYCIPRQPFFA